MKKEKREAICMADFWQLLRISNGLPSTLREKTRDTSAGRYMQRFADHPFDTWLLIAKNLKPYETRLRSKSATVGLP